METLTQAPQTAYVEVYPHSPSNTWMCRWISEPECSRFIQLFGTNVIPSAYTLALPFDEVFRRLRSIPANANVCFVEACA
jgi:hypothetical protein